MTNKGKYDYKKKKKLEKREMRRKQKLAQKKKFLNFGKTTKRKKAAYDDCFFSFSIFLVIAFKAFSLGSIITCSQP